MELQIRFCTSADGTRIAYATLGEGPPLVRIPSWGENLELDWQHPDARAFLESLGRGRLLVGFDRRGLAASQREVADLSLEAQVADVEALVDRLQLERFDLWGGLDGAQVAVAYAAQHPERVSRLVLWGAYPRGDEIARPEEIQSLAELIRQNWGIARRAAADVVFPSGPTELQRWWANVCRQSMSPEVAAQYLQFQFSVDLTPYLPQVKAPTLVLHRRSSRNVPISAGRAAAALIPDARFVALEGDIGHPYFGDTSYLETLTQFLDEGRVQKPAAGPPEAGAFRTVLFTDVEGSTALTQRLGDAKARELLREHEGIVREALKSHGGAEVKTMGDGFMASFTSATGALECAIAMQRAFAARNEGSLRSKGSPSTGSGRAVGDGSGRAEEIRVRIGLNAGEPIAEEDPDGRSDLFGTAVNEAARITATAKGGEILVSNVVRELAKGKDFLFADRGEASLKGFDEPVRLFEVRWREEG
ncbi:MAG: adenylate/guanylate cyclase domain-containing protein [Chloroflexi bacterium]|nr:adenylate/guanylate cyclase domain-containing protein [Chloroflexota bacterium]